MDRVIKRKISAYITQENGVVRRDRMLKGLYIKKNGRILRKDHPSDSGTAVNKKKKTF